MRKLEPYVVDSVMHLGESLALVSTAGVVVCRATNEFARIPKTGDHLQLETLDGSWRVTGIFDGDDYLLRYTDAELAEQDRRAHDDAVKAQQAAQQEEEA
jgi:hypothetical protein